MHLEYPNQRLINEQNENIYYRTKTSKGKSLKLDKKIRSKYFQHELDSLIPHKQAASFKFLYANTQHVHG